LLDRPLVALLSLTARLELVSVTKPGAVTQAIEKSSNVCATW
jgi:hypothetical protein